MNSYSKQLGAAIISYKIKSDITKFLKKNNKFLVRPGHLSDIEPQDQEHEHAEGQQIVDVVVVMCLGHLQYFTNGVGKHGMRGVEMIIHVLKKLILLIHLHPNIDRERFKSRDLAFQLALQLLISLLQCFIPHEPLGMVVPPVSPIHDYDLEA